MGVLSGTGGLTKTGVGTATLPGANTYAGTTTISAGTLAVGAAGTLGTGSVMVADLVGPTLTLANNNAVADAAILNFGSSSSINLNVANGTTETIAGLFDTTTSTTFNTPGVYTAQRS